LHLQLAAEVVHEHGREQVNLVGDQTTAWNVTHLGLILELSVDFFLSASSFMKASDAAGGRLLIGDDHLKLVTLCDRSEEIQLNGLLLLDSHRLPQE